MSSELSETARKVLSLLENVPVLDCESHPADKASEADLIAVYHHEKNGRVWIAIDALHLIGRSVGATDETWAVAAEALSHADVDMRDYAVRAFEQWDHSDAISLLDEAQKREPEKWLADFMESVILEVLS